MIVLFIAFLLVSYVLYINYNPYIDIVKSNNHISIYLWYNSKFSDNTNRDFITLKK